MKFFDAHSHLHDERLAPYLDEAVKELERLPVVAAVVNGTREEDWPSVRACAERFSWVIPAFGLHPWHARERSPKWLATLERLLDETPGAVMGEIGLDRWVEGYDLPAQIEVFQAQMSLAARRDLPVAIHCLKAWGALEEQLRHGPRPARGFLLHSYGGPAEMAPGLAKLGAYFSFSPYFLHPRKAAQREVFREIPAERLLVETDAPDMYPPPERNPHPLEREGKMLNHPANLEVSYAGLAQVRGISVKKLAELVEQNFQRWVRVRPTSEN